MFQDDFLGIIFDEPDLVSPPYRWLGTGGASRSVGVGEGGILVINANPGGTGTLVFGEEATSAPQSWSTGLSYGTRIALDTTADVRA
jgi:hypothetical protein